MAGDLFHPAEEVARASYSKLIAILSARTRDVSLAEDILAEAFQKALETWPRTGTPQTPEAWLLTVAKRKLIDRTRHHKVKEKSLSEITLLMSEAHRLHDVEEPLFPDDRLKLLFVCAHPSIAHHMHTPLMLQTVLGMEADRIARAFVIPSATMAQRLVRAKSKIKKAGIPFTIPDEEHLESRVSAVLNAIYIAYTTGWNEHIPSAVPSNATPSSLTSEAIWLGRVLLKLMPNQPEVLGLMALLLYSHARLQARHASNGSYIPLLEQNHKEWNDALIREAEVFLEKAATFKKMGKFQLEAAIQSAYCRGIISGTINWPAIILLYSKLIEIAPSLGTTLNRIGAVALSGRHADAQQLINNLLLKDFDTYQPYWALKAYIHKSLNEVLDANLAYDKAISLCQNPSMKSWLVTQQAELNA